MDVSIDVLIAPVYCWICVYRDSTMLSALEAWRCSIAAGAGAAMAPMKSAGRARMEKKVDFMVSKD